MEIKGDAGDLDSGILLRPKQEDETTSDITVEESGILWKPKQEVEVGNQVKPGPGILLKPKQEMVAKSAAQIVHEQHRNMAPAARLAMTRRVHPLVSLNPYQGSWTIKFRVTSKGSMRTYRNARGEGGVPPAVFDADTNLLRARSYMQEKIFVLLAQRHQQPINDSQMQKLKDIVKRQEGGLFKSSHSKDEYMNLDTLESQLHSLIKRPSPNNRNPVNPISMTMMIPSPGLSHSGSSTMMVTTSVDAPMSNIARSSSVQPTNANTGSLMSIRIYPKADIWGHLSCQSGTQLPGVSQQNGNVVPNIVAAGSGALHAAFSVDTDLLRARSYMQEKIFFLLAQRHPQPINDSQMQKLKDIVKRLEDGLFKSSHSKDEYMNLGTLESRLRSLIKRQSPNNRNPVNPNSMTTMIPTPGLSHNGSSTIMATSPVDAPMSNMAGSSSMQLTNANTGSLTSSGVMQTEEALCEVLCQLEL